MNEAQSKPPEPRHRRSGRGRRARRQAQQLSHITEVSGSPCAETATYRSDTSRPLQCANPSIIDINWATEMSLVMEMELQTTLPKESSPLKSQEKKTKGCGTKRLKAKIEQRFYGQTRGMPRPLPKRKRGTLVPARL